MTRAPAAPAGGPGAGGRPAVAPEVAAEAAVWIARLHGPSRTPQMEQEFRAWQAGSLERREAFERCTDVWQDVARIGVVAAYQAVAAGRAESERSSSSRRGAARRWGVAGAVVVTVAVDLVVALNWFGEATYNTSIGEQRLVVLQDGSRVLLNTDTEVRVDLGSTQRTVEVGRGEAFFEVAKDARRPFVVHIAGSEVVAVGTAFSVRYARMAHARDELAVTLVEGQVKVRPAGHLYSAALAPAQPVLMRAGERLRGLLDDELRCWHGLDGQTDAAACEQRHQKEGQQTHMASNRN